MSTFSTDDDRLAPYVCEDIAKLWNERKPRQWRTWQHSKSNSKSKSAQRLTIILKDNRKWLDCGKHSDINDLYDQFRTYLLIALAYIEREGEEKVNNILGSNYTMKIGFWAFIRDLQNVHYLAQLGLGNDPDQALQQDFDRRKTKAQLLKEFTADLKDFARQAAYLSGSGEHSNQKLEQALEAARTALAQAEDDLRWESQ